MNKKHHTISRLLLPIIQKAQSRACQIALILAVTTAGIAFLPVGLAVAQAQILAPSPAPAPAPSGSASAATAPEAELFDVKREQVIRLIPVTDKLREEAERWLAAGSGAAGETAFEPKRGFGLRVALIPPVQVDKPWYRGPVRELFLFADTAAGPHRLLFFDDQSRMHLIVLPYDLTRFLREYGIVISS